MKKRLLAAIMAAALAVSLLAGCSTPGSKEGDEEKTEESAGSGEDNSGKKVFRYSSNTEPTTMDSSKGNSVVDNELMLYITEGLVRNNCGTIEPGLAETWETSEDGTSITFHLRDAQWSDGEPITADDFVYAFQRLADPATASPYAWILSGHVKNGSEVVDGSMEVSELGVSAPDEKTFVMELEYPQNYMISLVGSCCQFTPVRKDIVEKWGTDYAADPEKMMTYGPFKLTSSANKIYVMEKNPDYWNADAIKLDRLEMSIIDNTDTALAMYEQGDLDYVNIPTAQVANYPDAESFMAGSLDWVYINNEAGPLSNQNLRLALNYALDRNEYNTLANGGVYAAWSNPVMPGVDGVNATYGEEAQPESYPLEGDEAKAKEYLQAALSELGGSASDINLEMVITDAESEKKAAEVLKERWQNVLGINVELRQVTYAEKYGNISTQHDFELMYAGWNPDYADPWTYLELFLSDNVYNYSQYKNADFDAAMNEAKGIVDPAARLEKLAEAEKILIDTAGVVPLQVRTTHYLLDDDVTGVGFYFSGYNMNAVYADCDPME